MFSSQRSGQQKYRKNAGLRAPCDSLRLDSKGMAPTHAYSWTVAIPSPSRFDTHLVVRELHVFPALPPATFFFADKPDIYMRYYHANYLCFSI